MCITNVLYRAINNRYAFCTIRYKKHSFNALIADTFLKQVVGLMHRPSLKRNEAMLFKFGREGIYPIWMLNMRFPIDILWLDKGFRVVGLAEGVKPCRGMFNCRTYSNSKRARYVLETSAGTARHLGIKSGIKMEVDTRCP